MNPDRMLAIWGIIIGISGLIFAIISWIFPFKEIPKNKLFIIVKKYILFFLVFTFVMIMLSSVKIVTLPNVFTDPRDGKKYKTVKIGNKTWMAENLNYEIDSSWCYDNADSNCAKYGRLYNWNAAIKACPTGWHLSTKEDWIDLVETIDSINGFNLAGSKLKSKEGWNNNGDGTDEFGFSALPGGSRNIKGEFLYVGDYGRWWNATENENGNALRRDMSWNSNGVSSFYNNKNNGYSVRCVKD